MIIDASNASPAEYSVLDETDRLNEEWCKRKVDALAMLHRIDGRLIVRVTTTEGDIELPDNIKGYSVEKVVRERNWLGE